MSVQPIGPTLPPEGMYSMAPPPVAVPTAKSQEMVLVRRSELGALKRGITRAMVDPLSALTGWAYAWLGVGAAATLSLLGIEDVKGNTVRTWVVEAHVGFVIVGFFLAAFCGWFAHKQSNRRGESENELHAEIDELNERAPTKLIEETAVVSAEAMPPPIQSPE